MFRCRRVLGISLRWIKTCTRNSDPLLEKLKDCRNEYQLFQLVGLNRSVLTANHVSCALNMLWEIQKENTNVCLSLDEVRNHPEFVALHILAENKVSCLDDHALVNTLYAVIRLGVEAHNSLMQQLVVEGWKRLEKLELSLLTKFTASLARQGLHAGPLYGQIASIVDRNLDNMQDLRALSILMVNLQSVCSQSLQHRLLTKAESFLEVEGSLDIHSMRRILQFLFNTGSSKHSQLEKWTQRSIQRIKEMDLNILLMFERHLSHTLEYPEVHVMVKSRLIELLESCNNTRDFTTIFHMLLPMVSQDMRDRLENNLLALADEIHYIKLGNILKSMAVANCRNSVLIHNELKKSSNPGYIALMTHTLSLSMNNVDADIISKLDAIVPQCNLKQINQITASVIKWLWKNPEKSNYRKLYQKLNKHTLERIGNTENFDVLSEEIMHLMKGHWFQIVYAEAILDTYQRFPHQITHRNAESLSTVMKYSFIRCTPVLDKIAAVSIENIEEFSPSVLYNIVRAFSFLNYEPPNGEEFYAACIQHCRANLDSIKPRLLLMLAFAFALAEHFPKDLIKAIFNADFLRRLDLVLDFCDSKKQTKIRNCLMELNRAVCLECPEYEIPWFHEQYCQDLRKTEKDDENITDYQIQYLLGAALGGIHYTRMSVVTPYYYSIDFECILDKNKNPVSYMDPNLLSTDVSNMQSGSKMKIAISLPSGFQRVAVDFLQSANFCRNSTHINSVTAMKKRHLEILGYSVIQIPNYEWNSMELGTQEAWIDYLKRKIFSEEI
ncbi:PREDICTED: FAST kinase domain-containing protein 1, mitochondrial-like [Nanorana parkeri]|uniref:FAST kinase domain-containing protein 1, mitochondrial-like n=1 Tax=Nanorana parkeri TaxID=125878 RepID=UPI000853F9E6|nr:PREDICTED: FAST kinase domain-containing protein 1, mitochondrial-like [Nanorana parkeri]